MSADTIDKSEVIERITINLSQEAKDRFEQIRLRLKLPDHVEVVRSGVALLDYISASQEQGCEITVTKPNGKIEKLVKNI